MFLSAYTAKKKRLRKQLCKLSTKKGRKITTNANWNKNIIKNVKLVK